MTDYRIVNVPTQSINACVSITCLALFIVEDFISGFFIAGVEVGGWGLGAPFFSFGRALGPPVMKS